MFTPTEADLFDLKEITVNSNGKVIITLIHKTLDEDGLEISSSFKKLVFEKNADVSNQILMVQKICADAWAAR